MLVDGLKCANCNEKHNSYDKVCPKLKIAKKLAVENEKSRILKQPRAQEIEKVWNNINSITPQLSQNQTSLNEYNKKVDKIEMDRANDHTNFETLLKNVAQLQQKADQSLQNSDKMLQNSEIALGKINETMASIADTRVDNCYRIITNETNSKVRELQENVEYLFKMLIPNIQPKITTTVDAETNQYTYHPLQRK